MNENDKSPASGPDAALEWAKLWQTMAESSNHGRGVVGFINRSCWLAVAEKPAGW